MMDLEATIVSSKTARYELVDTIASGGMARVYLGRARSGADASNPQPVAIKILHPHLAQDPDVVALFLDEARVSTLIRHPNVVEVRDVDLVGDDLVIIMEYVEGLALSGVIRSLRDAGAKMAVGVVVRVMIDALRGLHAAHELGDERGEPMRIVHRDVSPHNVLVGADGIARVADFGIATSTGRLAQTRTGDGVRGKLQYLAPEQIHRKTPDRRVDVWAAGLVLWECLTGKRLFEGGTEAETIADTLRAPIPPPSTLRKETTFELDDICLRALERDPDRRFATAGAFADALERESGVRPAPREDVAAMIYELAGAALLDRRDAFERVPVTSLTAATIPSAAAGADLTRVQPVRALPSVPVRVSPVGAPAPPAPARGNKLVLVAVAGVSLVIGGLGVRFAGARAGAETVSSAPRVSAETTASVPAVETAPQVFAIDAAVTSSVEASAAASAPPPTSASPPRATGTVKPAHAGEKKRVPKGATSASDRPFMPADL